MVERSWSESVSDLRSRIDLWQLHPIVGIVVAHPSGVVYTNQTGGYSTYAAFSGLDGHVAVLTWENSD